MKWLIWSAAIMMVMTQPAAAQDQPGNIEELNRKYQDALAQLKSAQDRKNELQTEKEQLAAKVAELEKQVGELKRQQSQWAEQTFQLRCQRAAWEALLQRYPRLREQWKQFIERDVLAAPTEMPELSELAPASAP